MSEPFIGEIVMFGGNFAPRNWMFCNGQLLSISQNTALFSILGTTYGGDGVTTFALPDLRGRVPVHAGNGPGLNPVVLGEKAGTSSTTLTINQLPPHTHTAVLTAPSVTVTVPAANAAATTQTPVGNIPAQAQQPGRTPILADAYAAPSAATGSLGGVTATATGGSVAVGIAGGGQPISTMPPYLGVNFIIATQGLFPSRN